MSITGEFARYLDAAIEACSRAHTAGGPELRAALEDAREAAVSDLAESARRSLAALDEHLESLESLESTSNTSTQEASVACRDLAAVGRVVLGR
jgi:hypothetical protein